MKAWFVFISGEWGELLHADTRGKAKAKAMHEFGVDEYISLEAHRVKKLDDKAFTWQNLQEVNWHYFDEDGQPLKEIDFANYCECKICMQEKQQIKVI